MKKRKLAKKVGAPPGTLVYTGERKEDFEISVFDYDATTYKEFKTDKIEDCFPFKDSPTVTWINIVGLHNIDVVENIGRYYSIHPLVLEDILNVHQRPKIEFFDDYIFVVAKMLSYNENSLSIESEQVSMIIGKNYQITFQERKGDVFEPVRERIRNGKGIIRKNKVDYLLYALLDVVVDSYFIILEKIGDELEDLEDRVILSPSPETSQSIHRLKRNFIELRKSVWPVREVLAALSRGESDLVNMKTIIYFRDVYDHAIRVIDTVETLRDVASGLLDIYLSSISNKMNETMKVLTIIATIFIPLTFIAGVYGMNFKYMPELEWKWGYPVILGIMLIIAVGMIVIFRRKRWL
jgi:magnesium transporter